MRLTADSKSCGTFRATEDGGHGSSQRAAGGTAGRFESGFGEHPANSKTSPANSQQRVTARGCAMKGDTQPLSAHSEDGTEFRRHPDRCGGDIGTMDGFPGLGVPRARENPMPMTADRATTTRILEDFSVGTFRAWSEVIRPAPRSGLRAAVAPVAIMRRTYIPSLIKTASDTRP